MDENLVQLEQKVKSAKPEIEHRQQQLLEQRYELSRWADQDLPSSWDQACPPYLHDDRLLTLDDTVEYFNLILGTKLSEQEKKDLVALLRTL